jgi:polysaccharide export outer membrane protein
MRNAVFAIRTVIPAGILALAGLWHAPLACSQQVPDYTVNAGDELEVDVWKEPDLIKKLIVRPDGKISFPLTGDVVAIGRTVSQIQTEISNKLKTYIPEPVVTVSVTGIEGNKVFEIGQVNKPGAYVMNPRYTVLQALSIAGGMTPFAATNDIMVLRRSGTHNRALPFHYGDVSKGRNIEQNVLLEAGDVIVVP